MAPHTINRAAVVVITPAVLLAGILSATIVLTIVGLPLLAVTLPSLVLALGGRVSPGPTAEVRPGLPWTLGAFAVLLLGGLALSATFGGDDLDQPEELVFGALAALWGVAAAVVAVRAHGAVGRTRTRQATPTLTPT